MNYYPYQRKHVLSSGIGLSKRQSCSIKICFSTDDLQYCHTNYFENIVVNNSHGNIVSVQDGYKKLTLFLSVVFPSGAHISYFFSSVANAGVKFRSVDFHGPSKEFLSARRTEKVNSSVSVLAQCKYYSLAIISIHRFRRALTDILVLLFQIYKLDSSQTTIHT